MGVSDITGGRSPDHRCTTASVVFAVVISNSEVFECHDIFLTLCSCTSAVLRAGGVVIAHIHIMLGRVWSIAAKKSPYGENSSTDTPRGSWEIESLAVMKADDDAASALMWKVCDIVVEHENCHQI